MTILLIQLMAIETLAHHLLLEFQAFVQQQQMCRQAVSVRLKK